MDRMVFVNIAGFSDEERHALNLLFRISGEHATPFAPWEPNAPEPARLALIDGQASDARAEAASPRNAGIPLIWIGEGAPANAWRCFQRPIAWPQVVRAMDELFPAPLDIDIDFDGPDTQPPDTLPPDTPPARRVLIAAADRDDRLYIRAKLSLADLTQADDAESAAQALELARMNAYALAVVDFGLPGAKGWHFVRDLAQGPRPVANLIVIAERPTWIDRMRARRAGVAGFFEKPPHPGRFHRTLLRV